MAGLLCAGLDRWRAWSLSEEWRTSQLVSRLIYITYSMEHSPSGEASSQEIPSHFVESEGSLPHSQVPATCPYPEPVRSSPYPHIPLLKIRLNIILPSTPGSPKWSTLHFASRNFCLASLCEFLHRFNPLNAELNPICPLLELIGAHHILHVSRIRVKRNWFTWLTL